MTIDSYERKLVKLVVPPPKNNNLGDSIRAPLSITQLFVYVWVDDQQLTIGAISSDLYRPQSQDEIVEFSFFVALSYEYNLQLGCLWWKISTSSLKTYFTNFVLTFVNLVSRHENCNFPRFTWWKVDEQRKMHWVTHIFITDYKKPSFSKIGQHLGTPERF